MVKKEITNVVMHNNIDTGQVLFLIDYDLIIFSFIRIPMATGGIIAEEICVNSSEEIFEIAQIILNWISLAQWYASL